MELSEVKSHLQMLFLNECSYRKKTGEQALAELAHEILEYIENAARVFTPNAKIGKNGFDNKLFGELHKIFREPCNLSEGILELTRYFILYEIASYEITDTKERLKNTHVSKDLLNRELQRLNKLLELYQQQAKGIIAAIFNNNYSEEYMHQEENTATEKQEKAGTEVAPIKEEKEAKVQERVTEEKGPQPAARELAEDDDMRSVSGEEGEGKEPPTEVTEEEKQSPATTITREEDQQPTNAATGRNQPPATQVEEVEEVTEEEEERQPTTKVIEEEEEQRPDTHVKRGDATRGASEGETEKGKRQSATKVTGKEDQQPDTTATGPYNFITRVIATGAGYVSSFFSLIKSYFIKTGQEQASAPAATHKQGATASSSKAASNQAAQARSNMYLLALCAVIAAGAYVSTRMTNASTEPVFGPDQELGL